MATPDLVRPLKLESPAEGGTQLDWGPTELTPTQDAIPMAAAYLQDQTSTTTDRVAFVDRTGTSLRFTDATASHVLGELVSATTGQVGSHDALRDLQHFLAGEGPGPGFASGCVSTRTYSGPLLTGEIWWTSSALTTKVLSKSLAYASGSPLPSSTTWTLYSAAGAQIRQLTDTFTYAGPMCTGATRTWS